MFLALKFFHSAANLAMIGVVISFMSFCRDKNYAIVLWCTVVAIIGYAVGIFQNIQDASIIPHLAEQYEFGNEALKQSILLFGVSNPFLFIVSLVCLAFGLLLSTLLVQQFNISILIILGFLWE